MTTIKLNGKSLNFQCNSEINGTTFLTHTSTHSDNKNLCKDLGEMFLCKIAWMLSNGFDLCYSDIDEYMGDAAMDLPWNEKDNDTCKTYIKNHTDFGFIQQIFSQKYPNCELI